MSRLVGAWLNECDPLRPVWWGKWLPPSGVGFVTGPIGVEAPQGVPLERWDTSGRVPAWVGVDPAAASELTSPRPVSDLAPAEGKPQPRAVGACSAGLSSRTARATSTRGLPEAAGSPTSSAEAP